MRFSPHFLHLARHARGGGVGGETTTLLYPKDTHENYETQAGVQEAGGRRSPNIPPRWDSSICMESWGVPELQTEVDPGGYLLFSEGRCECVLWCYSCLLPVDGCVVCWFT